MRCDAGERNFGEVKHTVKRPRLGFSFPAKILSAVLLPMPFVPTNPSTWPGRGVGSLQLEGGKRRV